MTACLLFTGNGHHQSGCLPLPKASPAGPPWPCCCFPCWTGGAPVCPPTWVLCPVSATGIRNLHHVFSDLSASSCAGIEHTHVHMHTRPSFTRSLMHLRTLSLVGRQKDRRAVCRMSNVGQHREEDEVRFREGAAVQTGDKGGPAPSVLAFPLPPGICFPPPAFCVSPPSATPC